MAAPIDPHKGLARAYAEYWLLPDLLDLNASGGGTVDSWSELLDREGFTMDHVDDDHLPEGEERHFVMAQDAWRMAEWLELTQAGGLTEAGRQVASVAGYPSNERTQALWRPAEAVIARQIRSCYKGNQNLAVVDIVQAGARNLAQAQDEWIRVCPGLLLVEFESLLHLAFADPGKAARLPGELAEHRRNAMRDSEPPGTALDELANMLTHADAVSEHYLQILPDNIDEGTLTLTAVQATLVLFVLCGLLKCPKPYLPVQYLVASDD